MHHTQLLIAAIGIAISSHARADNTVAISGIGTDVGNIHTHVDSVTYSTPKIVSIPNVGDVWETSGVVSGRGWGGAGPILAPPNGPPRGINAHYDYQVTWLARWPLHGNGKTLFMYHHGGGGITVDLARTDLALGANHTNRFAERLGDPSGSVPALVNKATYIAMNRRGMLPGGFFAAKFVEAEVSVLTDAEAATLVGLVGYVHPDFEAGDRVPTGAISVDTATFRDVDLALQRVVASVSGRTFREKIFFGTSAGATCGTGIAFGCSAIGTQCVNTGGNHAIAYDLTSPRIFDAFIFGGFPYPNATPRYDPIQPLVTPVMFIQGRADERYQMPIRMAAELQAKGVTLAGKVWIYEIANQPHIARDTELVVPEEFRQAESNGPWLGAAIRNMRELLAGDAEPPISQIAGRIAEDAKLTFDVVGGTTREMPVREHLGLDTIVTVGQPISIRTVDVGAEGDTTARWTAVTATLPHINAPIYGPTTTCRVGAYATRFTGSAFSPNADLIAAQGSFAAYRDCVTATVEDLTAQDLYDPRVETAKQTADRLRSLFP